MTQQEIIAGNKLIAEFMGYKYYGYNEVQKGCEAGWKKNDSNPSVVYFKLDAGREVGQKHFLCRNHHGLRFYNSWDWIMPACKKFDDFRDKQIGKFEPNSIEYLEYAAELDSCVTLYETKVVFEQLVTCIKWYNEIKQDEQL